MSTHNLCFGAKIRKNVYPCKPQFYYIKVSVRGCSLHRHVFMMFCLHLLCVQIIISLVKVYCPQKVGVIGSNKILEN